MTYDDLIKKYDKLIKSLAQKIDSNNWEDYAQDMRLFILQHHKNYDAIKSPEDYYVKMMIFTAYRRKVFDKTKQQKFENGFVRLVENIDVPQDFSNYDYLVECIVEKLKKPQDKIVFYSIVYDTEGSNYKELAKYLRMNYMSFLNSLNKIKKIVLKLKKEESVLQL